MVRSKLVDHWIVDGRRVVEKMVSLGYDIEAAFWTSESEESPWYLMIVTEANSTKTLLKLWNSLEADGSHDLNLLNAIRLVGSGDRRATLVVSTLTQNQDFARTYRGNNLAEELGFEELFIYPPRVYQKTSVNRMTSDDVGRALLGFMQVNTAPANWPRVHLTKGEEFTGMPTRIFRANGYGIQVEFNIQNAIPQAFNLDEIAAIV